MICVLFYSDGRVHFTIRISNFTLGGRGIQHPVSSSGVGGGSVFICVHLCPIHG